MPPRENSKAAAAKAKKAEAAEAKNAAQQKVKDAKEEQEWSKGAKGKSKVDAQREKDEEARRKKAERERLLKEEEESLPSKPKKEAPKAGGAKAKLPPVNKKSVPSFEDGVTEPTSFSASGIDDALDLLTLVSAKNDKASVGAKAAEIEQHPERRFKAAFEAYKEEMLPQMRKDFPGLRLQQYHDRLYKDFQKSDRNPFNQATLSYDATKQDKVAALKKSREATSDRLRAD